MLYTKIYFQDVCMSLFMREKGAKIRSAAISVLVKVNTYCGVYIPLYNTVVILHL